MSSGQYAGDSKYADSYLGLTGSDTHHLTSNLFFYDLYFKEFVPVLTCYINDIGFTFVGNTVKHIEFFVLSYIVLKGGKIDHTFYCS